MSVMQSAPGAETIIDGRRYLYFAGTGYYGLQGHPEVIRAACDAVQQYGIGSATSRSGYGANPPMLEAERLGAAYFGDEASFYYVSGYVGNSILVHSLHDRFDVAFVDELAHYSVLEGVRSEPRPVVTFRHCDPDDLAAKLAASLKPGQRPMLITDGVFPTLGRIAPVPEYVRVLEQYPGALLCLDDAHATGTLGANGRGVYEHFGLSWGPGSRAVELYFSTTLSKAIGGQGGLISGSQALIESIKQGSHFFNGASQPSVPVAAATARALEIAMAQPEIRRRLWANVARMKSGLRRLGLATDDTPVPIISLAFESSSAMQRLQKALMDRGIVIAYIRAYTGLGPEGGLRIAVFSTHTEEMIDSFLDEMAHLI